MMNNILLSSEELLLRANEIEGWLSPDEMNLLYDTTTLLSGCGHVVEIGSWCGKSLTVLVAASIASGLTKKVFSIDPYTTSVGEPNGKYETFISNLKNNGIWEKVFHIKEKSQIVGEQFKEDIEFIFIDGFHKYEAVKLDFELFSKKVVNNGYIALHDTFSFFGPTQVIVDILSSSSNIRFVKQVDSIVLFQKVQNLSVEDIAKNNEFLAYTKAFMSEKGSCLV